MPIYILRSWPYDATDQPERAQQLERFRAHGNVSSHVPYSCSGQRPGSRLIGVHYQWGARSRNAIGVFADGFAAGRRYAPRTQILPRCSPARAWKRYNYDSYMEVSCSCVKISSTSWFPNDFWGGEVRMTSFETVLATRGFPSKVWRRVQSLTKRGWISTRKCHCYVTGDSSVLISGNGASGIGVIAGKGDIWIEMSMSTWLGYFNVNEIRFTEVYASFECVSHVK